MTKIYTMAFLLFFNEMITAQSDTSSFDRLLAQSDALTKSGDYAAAYYQYNAAKVANPSQSGFIDEKIAEMLLQINGERQQADSTRILAEERSLRLHLVNNYLGFVNDRAWVYGDSIGLFALINKNGVLLSGFRFQEPQPFQEDNTAIVKENGHYVLVNLQGDVVSTPFDWRIPMENGNYIFLMDNQWSIYGGKLKEKVAGPFLQIDDEGSVFWAQNLDSKWGLMEKSTQKWLVRPHYEEVSYFENGWAKVKEKDKWGYVNEAGDAVIATQYDNIGDFNEGFATFSQKGLYGFINIKGKEILGAQFEKFNDFSEGKAAVLLGDKWGIMDTLGELIVMPKFDFLGSFNQGTAIASVGENKWGLVDVKGNWVTRKKYYRMDIKGFGDNLLWVQDNKGKWGAINRAGEEVIEHLYDQVKPFENGSAWVEIDQKWGLIDQTGTKKIELKYEAFKPFSEGLAAVKRTGLWGYTDLNGREVVPAQYQDAAPFGDNLAAVKLNNRTGFINRDGEKKLPFIYLQAGTFSETGVWASEMKKEGERYGLLNNQGTWLIPPQFERVEPFKNNRAWVSKNGSSFYINNKGEMVNTNKD